jgi:hypothetical protein
MSKLRVVVSICLLLLLSCRSSSSPPPSGSVAPGAATAPHSDYAEQVVLPACNRSSSEVLIIDDDSDWSRVNDARLRIFCVVAGDYSRAGVVELQRSGRPDRPRVLRYYDPSDSAPPHPVRMASADRAVLASLVLRKSDHWIIDGLTIQGSPRLGTMLEHASHNVLNRMLFQDSEGYLLRIRGLSNHNVLQNSVLRRAAIAWGADRICLFMQEPGVGRRQQGNRIVQNELYDCTDGIQLYLAGRAARSGTFPGLLIDANDIYLTPARRTNCQGIFEPEGGCGCAENGIDVKVGGASGEPGEYVTISNNRVWGWRESDDGIDGTGERGCGASGSWGDFIGLHRRASYVMIRDNILLDGPRGIGLAYGVHHVSVIGNTLYAIGSTGSNRFAIGVGGPNNEIYGNTIVDSGIWLAAFGVRLERTEVRCNTILASRAKSGRPLGPGSSTDYNFFFDTKRGTAVGRHDVVRGDVRDAGHEELCFWRTWWTGPERICIPNGRAGAESIYAATCDPALGSVRGSGIDDRGSSALH